MHVSSSFLDLKIPLLEGDRATLPKVRPVRQKLESHQEIDVAAAVHREMSKADIRKGITPGMTVAVGVGSRGIANYVEVVKSVVRELSKAGAKPFLVPAMGSHGGSTAEGQIGILEGLGITEASIGAPIRASMETIVVGTLADGTPLHVDALAAEADGIVAVNRVKAHTLFRGPLESGLCKMLVVGLGKAVGAKVLHGRGTDNFTTMIPEGFALLRSKVRILFGVAIVEDGFGELGLVEAIAADRMPEREAELLRLSVEWMASLFFEELDICVLANFGKDVSGQGADPNIMGRNLRGSSVAEGPRIGRLIGLHLTEVSHGNASGIGQLDMITADFLRDTDLSVTYLNVLPTGCMDGAALPIVARTGADAVALAMTMVPGRSLAEVRLAYVRDTKHLSTIFVSEALTAEVEAHPRLEFIGDPVPLAIGDSIMPWPDEPHLGE